MVRWFEIIHILWSEYVSKASFHFPFSHCLISQFTQNHFLHVDRFLKFKLRTSDKFYILDFLRFISFKISRSINFYIKNSFLPDIWHIFLKTVSIIFCLFLGKSFWILKEKGHIKCIAFKKIVISSYIHDSTMWMEFWKKLLKKVAWNAQQRFCKQCLERTQRFVVCILISWYFGAFFWSLNLNVLKFFFVSFRIFEQVLFLKKSQNLLGFN